MAAEGDEQRQSMSYCSQGTEPESATQLVGWMYGCCGRADCGGGMPGNWKVAIARLQKNNCIIKDIHQRNNRERQNEYRMT